jgi:HEAT repeat protein
VTGRLTKEDVAETRSLVQRLLWMMRDESGNNVGSAPEILGEIVRNSPEQFSDIVPILASFHDEAGLRRGVFRALERIAEVSPDLCGPAAAPQIGEYIDSEDEYVRAYAILLVGMIGLKQFTPSLEGLLGDSSAVTIYRQGTLQSHTVGRIAEETLIKLGKEGEK